MRKTINRILIGALLLGVSTSNVFAKDFSDLSSKHWAYKQIQSLAKDSVVVGYPSGIFKPDEPVTRAEFATMAIKALRQENAILKELYYFSDVADSYWAYDYVQRAQAFDLVKGFPDGSFKPEDTILKVEAVSVIISAVNTEDITEAQAKESLKLYKDANKIPSWAIIPAGKSERYGVTAHNPETKATFQPDTKITRAEVAACLYNMRKYALANPNPKLAEAMKPRIGEGIVVEDATVDGTIATVPAGTLIPVSMMTAINSQRNEKGEVFTAEVANNLVTKEKYLLFTKGSSIAGDIVEIKPARYFVRNAKVGLDTQYIKVTLKQKFELPGNIDTKNPKKKGFMAVVRCIIRGQKIKWAEGKQAYVKLSKPVRVDLTNGAVIK